MSRSYKKAIFKFKGDINIHSRRRTKERSLLRHADEETIFPEQNKEFSHGLDNLDEKEYVSDKPINK